MSFLSSYLPARKYSAFEIESDAVKSNNFCSYLSQLSFAKAVESLEGEIH